MSGRACAWHFVLLSLFLATPIDGAFAQANVQGQWTTMSTTMPINPIHVALLANGKLLIIAGSGNCPPSQSGCPSGPPYGPSNSSGALLFDPIAGKVVSQFTLSWDMFCNDMALLTNGTVLIAGGTIQYDPFYGSPQASIFDPGTNTFSDIANMAHGRWYPTTLTLGDGRIMTFSGFTETGGTNTSVEYYTPGSGWSQAYDADWTPDMYPRMHLLPSGKVFYSGSQTTSKLFDPATNTWNTNFATTNYPYQRTYGTSVLLPLTPANNYDPKIIVMGGDNPATDSTEIIDMGSSSPAWQWGPAMSAGRIEMNAVILPNGKVLAVGGSVNDEDVSSASLQADLYDPVTNTFSPAGKNAYPRLYHSTALLLPDATVWLAGGNPTRGSYVPQMEIYKPPYLFNSDGSAATRPTMTNVPSTVEYGQPFTINSPDAANIGSVVLLHNATVTHAFDKDQREVGLSFSAGSGTLTITGPPNSNIAPPGYYMLFVLNKSGVPSMANFVQVTQPSGDFSISANPSSASVTAGQSTSYTVSITPSSGFNGTVNLSVTGLPSGATGTFSPTSISVGQSSTLTVNTSSNTPAGTSTLTITGSTGSLSHSAQVSLVVSAGSVGGGGGGSGLITQGSYYRIINQASGACVDDSGNLYNGAPLTQWQCWPGNTNQEWWFKPSTTISGDYTIGDLNTTSLIWTVKSGGTADNTNVEQDNAGTAKYMQWTAKLLSTGYYEFIDANSGKCLTVPGGSNTNGLQLQISTCTGSPSQAWVLGQISSSIAQGAWYEVISNRSGDCVTDPNSATANGTWLVQQVCGSLLNQEWQFTPVNGYQAVYSGSSSPLVWDDTDWSTNDGNGMQLWSWSDNSNQHWTPAPTSDGMWSFTVQTSGMCLDNNQSMDNGTRMIQWTCYAGNVNQEFELDRVR